MVPVDRNEVAWLITLHLPAKPGNDVEAVALAAGNATGGQYPFACG